MNNSLLFGILYVIVVLLIVVSTVAFWQREQKMTQVPPLLSPSQDRPEPAPRPILTPTAQPSLDPTANWKAYHNEKYGFELEYPEVFVVIDKMKECDNAYENVQCQYVEFRTPEQVQYMEFEEFPMPSFSILMVRTSLSLDQWVENIVGCESEATWRTDICVNREEVEERSIGDFHFTIFHEPGPVKGAFHHATKKDDILLDIQTFLPPGEDSLKIYELLKNLKWL